MCLGLQLAVVEFARNMLQLKGKNLGKTLIQYFIDVNLFIYYLSDANSSEFLGDTENPVVSSYTNCLLIVLCSV